MLRIPAQHPYAPNSLIQLDLAGRSATWPYMEDYSGHPVEVQAYYR
jgi:hypothetical protein